MIKEDVMNHNKKKNRVSQYWTDLSLYRCVTLALMISGVILLLDINGLPTLWLEEYGRESVVTVIALGFVLFLVVMLKRHCLAWIKIPCQNIGDEMILSIMLCCLIIGIFELIFSSLYMYKRVLLVLGVFISLILILVHYFLCRKREKSIEKSVDEKTDLIQLLEGKVKHSKLPITFAETASDLDLLGREGLVNVICDSIRSCSPDHVYVIGIKGAWGSGKTTIINIVKKNIMEKEKDLIVIDDFDPWIFGTQEALLTAMYDEILLKTGIKYGSYSRRIMVNQLMETVTNHNEWSGIFSNLINVEQCDYEAVKQLKVDIANYLGRLDKKVVFIIDNIDRVESDNILFLFKLIGSVFNFPNVVYLLAYDDKRIQEVFADVNKINPKYIEKIVQQEITIPDISDERMEIICRNCIEKVLYYYGVDKEQMIQYVILEKCICRVVTNLRQLKRLLNSAFISVFLYDNILYKPHLLAIETIKFFEPSLYEIIKNNWRYFISQDYSLFEEIALQRMDRKKFNETGKIFFGELFEKYGIYKDLLAEMFPYVKRYRDGIELQSEYVGYDDSLKHGAIPSIASAKYFGLYFSYDTNDYVRTLSDVDKFIKKINDMSKNRIPSATEESILRMKKEEHDEWFVLFQNKIKELHENVWIGVATGICKSMDWIDKSRKFAFGSADQRALVVVTQLLKGAETNEIKEFIGNCAENYNIRLLDEICSNCASFIKNGDNGYEKLQSIMKEEYEALCEKIITQKIDLYEDPIYQRKKIWSLYRAYSDKEIVHKYMREVIKPTNLFRILSDMVRESVGTGGYGYWVKENYIIDLFGEKESFQFMVEKAVPTNETEEFLLKLWNRMQNGEKDYWGEDDYHSPIPVNLEL